MRGPYANDATTHHFFMLRVQYLDNFMGVFTWTWMNQ